MTMNIKSLNVNPCKMCMPMGSVTALYGIKHCMSILHGSQGCATYIRRHMATHYNEPVDIASSALTEEGTVFGGEKNLLIGLENVIRLYAPEVIGISTTCLAETIGEDVRSIIVKFYQLHPDCTVKIIHVASGGYAGTQYEGFFRAIYAVLEQTEQNSAPNNKITVITGQISPADTRWLKELLNSTGLSYILLPDLSDNLDGGYNPEYSNLPSGGTTLEEIGCMAGARHTIELSTFLDDAYSPAKYLYERFHVPYTRLDLPIGLRATDLLLETLKALGGHISDDLKAERGRYLDAIVDAHKYSALGRAVVFGEPDFVQGVCNLCCESGIVPVVVATGSECRTLKERLNESIAKAADRLLLEKYFIQDDADFDTIEGLAVAAKANIMIGNSDGRRAASKLGLDLIRYGFPIHDQMGGQRVRLLGYGGSLELIDKIDNALLLRQAKTFRSDQYAEYFKGQDYGAGDGKSLVRPVKKVADPVALRKINDSKTLVHPCYNCGAGDCARIHLPVAPKCNVQCNYCVRKYDCPNESRPGVTSEILSPQEALEKYLHVKAQMPNLTVVGIAGPGDALANFEQTKETLRLIRAVDPDIAFCLSTNGLMLPLYAQELIDLGVSHVTVTINAVDPKIGARVYDHVDFMGQRFYGESAAGILLGNQISGLRYLTDHGIVCKANIVMLKGINDEHIEKIVKTIQNLHCEITNIMQMIPVKGSVFEHAPLVSNKEVMTMRKKCETYMKQMYHCRQCRADAIGTLGKDVSLEFRQCLDQTVKTEKHPYQRVAVASQSGILVDQHFGQAVEFFIYDSDGDTVKFVEKRDTINYCNGPVACEDKNKTNKTDKIDHIINMITDCRSVLALRIGDGPTERLAQRGIKAIPTYDRIEDAVKKAVSEVNITV